MRYPKKKKVKRFCSPIDWAVTALAVLLLGGGVLGLIKVYFVDAGPGLNTLSRWERYCMSVVPVPDGETDRLEKRPVSLYGSVLTADGATLFDVLDQAVDEEAYGSLLGSINDVDTEETRYLLPRYRDRLWADVDYDPLAGIKSGAAEIQLTLNAKVQELVYDYMKESGVIGSVTCYDYRTGDVICLGSTPGWLQDGDGSFINRCLYNACPGSTQKLLAHFLLTKAGVPADEPFNCTGSYTLRTGETIVCPSEHGPLDGRSEALGVSCNCYFARELESLDLNWVRETLKEIGVSVNGSDHSASLGMLPVDTPSVALVGSTWTFSNIWNLVGQDASLQSPLWMAEFAADLLTGGQAVQPRITTDEEPRKSEMGERYAAVFSEGYPVWKAAFDGFYSDSYGDMTCAKTGTADELGPEKRTQKTLCLVSEDLGVSAFLVVENYDECHVMPVDLANELLAALKSSETPE